MKEDSSFHYYFLYSPINITSNKLLFYDYKNENIPYHLIDRGGGYNVLFINWKLDKNLRKNIALKTRISMSYQGINCQSNQFSFYANAFGFDFSLYFENFQAGAKKLSLSRQIKYYKSEIEKSELFLPIKKEALVRDAILTLQKTNDVIDFDVFLMIFQESLNTPFIVYLCDVFNFQQMKITQDFNKDYYINLLQEMSKKKTDIVKKMQTVNKNESMNKLYTLFVQMLGYLFINYDINRFIQEFEGKNKKTLFKTIIDNNNIKTFRGLSREHINKIIKIMKPGLLELNSLLQLAINLNTAIQIILDNFEFISHSYAPGMCITIEPNQYLIDQHDNIDKFIELVSILRKKLNEEKAKREEKIDFIIIDFKIWETYIGFAKDLDLNKLFKIRDNVKDIVMEKEINELTTRLNNTIISTGITLIEEKKLQKESLLEYIIKLKDYFRTIPIDRDLLINSLYIQDAENNQKFIDLFTKVRFDSLYNEQEYQLFFNKIIGLFQSSDKFPLIFQLFPYAHIQNKTHIISKLFHVFQFHIKRESILTHSVIIHTIKMLFRISTIENEFTEIFNIIKTKESNTAKTIFKEILKYLPEKLMNISQIIIEYFISSDGVKQFDSYKKKIIELLDIVKENENNKSLIKVIFKVIASETIQRKDIFSNESFHIPLLEFILAKGFFNDREYEKTEYIYKSKQEANSIIADLIQNNYTGEEGFMLQNKGKLSELFMTLCFNDKKNADSILSVVIKELGKIQDYYQYLEQIDIFNNFFYSGNKEKNQQVSTFKEMIQTRKIKDYVLLEINKLKAQYNEAISYNYLLVSQFFKILYQNCKETIIDDIKIRETAKDQFYKIKDYLFDKNKCINYPYIDIIVKVIKKKDALSTEYRNLKSIFKITTDTQSIEDTLLLVSYKKNVEIAVKSIIFFLNQYSNNYKNNELLAKFMNFEKQFPDDYNDKLFQLLNKISKELFIPLKIDIGENQGFLEIITKLYLREDFFTFIEGKNIEEMRRLTDFIGNVDDNTISGDNINSLVEVLGFLAQLTKEKKSSDKQFLLQYKELFDRKQNIGHHFVNVLSCVQQFQEFIVNIKDTSLQSRTVITKLMEDSMITITNENGEVNITVICKSIQKKLSFFNVIENRDIVLLKKTDTEEVKSFLEQAKVFSNTINHIITIRELLEELTTKGHTRIFDYSFIINNNQYKITSKIQSKIPIRTCEDLIKNLKMEIQNVQEIQHELYKEDSLYTFIYGKLSILFCNYIKDRNNPKYKKKAEDYLKYLIGAIPKNVDKPNINVIDYKEARQACNEYLKKLFYQNNFSIDTKYKASTIKEFNGYRGLYTKEISNKDSTELSIMKCIEQLTGSKVIIPHTTLLCNELTSSEEIIAFLYRAFYCKSNILFTIINAEHLLIENRTIFINTLKKITSDDSFSMVSCVMIFYKNRDNDIIDQIQKFPFHKKADISISSSNIDIIQSDNITIVDSNASGVGKSFLINKFANDNKKKYIYFPLGDELKKETIIKRLCELKIDSKTLLHLDLLETNKAIVMQDFLFSLLILHYYSYEDQYFVLDPEVVLKIEVPNGFFNFIDKYPILKLFKKTTITKENKPQMIVSNDILSDIQIVCNYLKVFYEKKINTRTVIIKGIVPFTNKMENNENYYIATPLSQQECLTLLSKEDPSFFSESTYYQINAFLSVLSNQLKYLTTSRVYSVESLKPNNLTNLRSYVVEAFIKNTIHFTIGAYNDLLKCQQESYNHFQDEKSVITNLLSTNKNSITFDQIKPSLVFFNGDGQSLSIISTSQEDSDENRQLTAIWRSQSSNKEAKLDNYKELTQLQFLTKIKLVLNLRNRVEKAFKGMKPLTEIIGSYVFTADNFIKMILILLRTRAKIPVVMMGETGCGKTSLIKMISILRDNAMITLDIHAGITEEDIISFMENNGLIKGTENNQKAEWKKRIADKDPNFNIWVFFDEINTCNAMNLISEILCKKTVLGRPVINEVIFIAACNPYRVMKGTKEEEDIGLKNKDHKIRSLVYTVNPLPHSLLNFVFDFGCLTKENEKRYIQAMLKKTFDDILQSKEENQVYKNAVDLIFAAQDYLRTHYDSSSVSLREVRRCAIFIKSFYDFLRIIQTNSSIDCDYRKDLKKWTVDDLLSKSLNLCLFLCYYLRIPNKKVKNDLLNEPTFKKYYKDIKHFSLFPNQIMEHLGNEIIKEKGIAKNKALKENIFTLFFCIINRIPVFICGKPGTSKSLSVQLLFNAMVGESSSSKLLQKFPRLTINSYQGAKTSTSEGVERVFQKAKKYLEGEYNKGISLVYFDELGLAELSPNNPLKVLHKELELDINGNTKQVAFVGISNWTLDASKMNRGVFLSILDPDEEDFKETAKAIQSSYEIPFSSYEINLLSNLASTYYKFKNDLPKTKYKEFSDFFGTRDFYHLIKVCCRLFMEKQRESIGKIMSTSIERNFGGLDWSIKYAKEILLKINTNLARKKINTEEYNVMECIQKNIEDIQSRFLLIVAKESLSPALIRYVLEKNRKEYKFLKGSQLEGDIKNQSYSVDILNKIQIAMEKKEVLMLQSFDYIYPSLYDLFNQNYTEIGGKKNARIALGTSNNSSSFVNDNFRCIILLDSEEIKNQDPPFLNRFEKHILSFDYLIDKKYSKLLEDVISYIYNIFELKDISITMILDQNAMMLNIDTEEIKALFYGVLLKRGNDINKEIIISDIIESLYPSFSQELIFFINSLSISDVKTKVNEKYAKLNNQSLYKYLSNISFDKRKSIIYTYTTIISSITFNKKIENRDFGSIDTNNLMIIEAYTLSSERKIESILNYFYNNSTNKVLILRFRPVDCQHLNHIIGVLDNYEKTYSINPKEKKIVIFMIHLQRIFTDTEEYKEDEFLQSNKLVSHLSSYYQIFIDNLDGKDINIIDIINSNNSDLILKKELIDANQIIKDKLYECFLPFKILNNNPEVIIKDVINQFRCSTEIQDIFINKIKTVLDNEKRKIYELVFYKDRSIYSRYDPDFVGIIRKYLENIIVVNLTKFLFYTLSDGSLCNFFDKKKMKGTEKTMLINNFNEIKLIGVNLSNLPSSIQLEIKKGKPTSYNKEFYMLLRQYVNTIAKDYIRNQDDTINRNYESSMMNLIEKVKEKQLYKLGNDELYKKFLNDYIINYVETKYKSKEINNIDSFIELIIQLQLSINESNKTTKEDYLKEFATLFIWMESYSQYIYDLCDIFISISTVKKDFNIIKNKIQNEQIEENANTKLKTILRVFETLCSILLDNTFFENNYLMIRELVNKGMSLEKILDLHSKNIYRINILYLLQEYLNSQRQSSNVISNLIQLFSDEEKMKDQKELPPIIKKEMNLINSIYNSPEFTTIYSSILLDMYKLNKDKNNITITNDIIQYFVSDKEIIIKAQEFFNVCFIEEITNKKLTLKFQDHNALYELIQSKILNNFEGCLLLQDKILFYFENFYINEIRQTVKAGTILLNTDYLKTCIDYILKNDNNELYHVIGIIKAIGYIKPYLYQLVKYIVEERQLLTQPDNYIRIVDNIGNQKLKQMLQLYIIKLFKHHMNKDLKSLMRTVDWNSSLIISQNEVNDIVQNETLKNIIETDSFPAEDGSSSYPYQNLFRVFPYPEMRSFKKAILDNQKRYPILHSYLTKKSTLDNLSNLSEINTIENELITKRFCQITRKEAQDRKENNANLEKLFSYCIKIKPSSKYNQSKDVPLSELLNSKNSSSVITNAYQELKSVQNEFLLSITSNMSKEHPLYYLKTQIENCIIIQDAKEEEIIDTNRIFGQEYINLEHIITTFSRRNCYSIDGNINYNIYNQMHYDYDKIEEEFGKLLLKGKRMFSKEEKYFTYSFERNSNLKSIYTQFEEKYPQDKTPLSQEDIEKLAELVQQHNLEVNKDFEKLIYYLLSQNYSNTKLIIDVIRQLPDYLTLNNTIHNVFGKREFKLNQIMKIVEYIEEQNFDTFVVDRLPNYSNNIDIKIQDELKQDIKSILRKFVWRYLELDNQGEDYLTNTIFKEIYKLDDFKNLRIDENVKTILNKIKINQIKSLHNLLENKINNKNPIPANNGGNMQKRKPKYKY